MAFRFSSRSINNLIGVHPYLVDLMHAALAKVPYDFIVTEGLRSYKRQAQLKREGKSQTLNSYHLRQEDGYGHAVDIAIIPPEGGVTWEMPYYLANADVILAIAKERGLTIRWGGDFGNKGHGRGWDCPHLQIEPRYLPIK